MNDNINLIVGTGVIGAYLAKLLLKKKQKIIVTSRKIKKEFKNYKYLGIQEKVKFIKLNIYKKSEIERILSRYVPKKIFYFAGQSSLPKSIVFPEETYNSHFLGTKNFLEVLRQKKSKIKFFKANSGYIFKPKKGLVNLNCKFSENKNPYISAQKKTFKLIDKFRKLNLSTYNLVFFQVESPLRPDSFFIKKVCLGAIRKKKIIIGNVKTSRDYSWAPEIVKFIFEASNNFSQNFLISAGKKFSGTEILKYAYQYKKLDYRKYYQIDKKFFRKNENILLIGDPKNTKNIEKKFKLNFNITKKLLINKMIRSL
jgi:GDPmannose 4,6-dehydratase